MKKIKIEHVFSSLFIIFIIFFMCTIAVRVFSSKILHMEINTPNASEQNITSVEPVSTKWDVLYPYDNSCSFEYREKTEDSQTVQETTEKSKYLSSADELKGKIDYYSTKLLFGRMAFVEANASFCKAVGEKIITGSDSVVSLRNGYLSLISGECDTDYAAESLSWFSNILKEKNVNFLYVQYPAKESPYLNMLPVGVTDNHNKNADRLLESLKKEKVDFIDFRILLNEHTSDWYGSFYKTDHHWKAETGVWAAGIIANHLNVKFGYDVSGSVGNTENYNIKVYEKYSLGSEGKISTLKFADPEDFSIITPKIKTSYDVQYFPGGHMAGRFEDVLINISVFDKKDYYNISCYSSYMYGNHAIVSIHNNDVKNGKRLLVIGDSFCNCVVPYLSCGIEYIDVIDKKMFNGSIISYISSFKPDTVIVAYYPGMLHSNPSRTNFYNFE